MGRKPKINLSKAAELRANGLQYNEIGAIMGVSKQAVQQALSINAMLIPSDNLEEFKSKRGDILASKQAQLLNSLTPDKIKDASAYQLTGMFSLLHERERLERGQSTSNVAYYDIDSSHAKLAQQRRELLNRIGYNPSDQEQDDTLDNPDMLDTTLP